MKSSGIKLIASVVTAAAVYFGGVVPALASTLIFAPEPAPSGVEAAPGAVDGYLSVTRLGNLQLPHGRASIQGDSIELSIIGDWQFSREVVLTGRVLDTRFELRNAGRANSAVSAAVFFTGGAWLPQIDSGTARETVVTSSGSLTGRIDSLDQHAVVLKVDASKVEVIELAQIQDIRSPRAYRFSVAATVAASQTLDAYPPSQPFQFESGPVALVASAAPFHMGAIKHSLRPTGDESTARLVANGTLFTVMQLAQLTPLLVLPINSQGLRRSAFFKQYPFNVQSPAPIVNHGPVLPIGPARN